MNYERTKKNITRIRS